jgi:hypothetical protein
MQKLKYFICGLFCLISCKTQPKYPYNEEGLTLQSKLIYNNQIRMNGFFCDNDTQSGYGIRYFFEDGYCTNFGKNNIEEQCPELDSNTRRVPYYWGIYQINGDTIHIQQIDSKAGIFEKFGVVNDYIRIVNDTTLHWFKKVMPNNRIFEMNVLYKFRTCPNKPNSNNILMRDNK